MEGKIDLEQIYKLYMKDLFHYVFSLTKDQQWAEDVVQETFYRAYIYLEMYNGEKIKPWLFKVAYNTFIDMLRKNKRLVYLEEGTIDLDPNREVKSAEDEFLLAEEINDWFVLVKKLGVEKRNAVLLRDYYDFTYEEIAQLMGVSMPKIKVLIHRGRKELQQLISQYKREE